MDSQVSFPHAKALQDELLCPVLLEPLSQAVCLVPCAHKVQQAAAEKIFGRANGGWLVQSNKPCPICKVPVRGYMVDHSTRSIVKQLCELPEKELNTMLTAMKNNLVEKSKIVEKEPVVDMPYPGKPARFVHIYGDWNLYHFGGMLCRMMDFTSTIEDSLIEKFSILGYRDGHVEIYVILNKNTAQEVNINNYFKKYDIIVNWIVLDGVKTANHNQLQQLFNIIAENNEIPSSHFDKIRSIVAQGTHNPSHN